MGYRNLRMHPALQPPPSSPPPKQQRAHGDLAQAAWQQAEQGCLPAASCSPHDWQPGAHQPALSAVPSLLDLCQAELLSGLSVGSVCEVLQVADCLSPVVDGLRRWAGLSRGRRARAGMGWEGWG